MSVTYTKKNFIDLEIPKQSIAVRPCKDRVSCKLLTLDKDGVFVDTIFSSFPNLLSANDLLVLNDSKVMPVRFVGHKSTGGKVDLLITEFIDLYVAKCLVKTKKSLQVEDIFYINNDIAATVIAKNKGDYTVKFSIPTLELIAKYGSMPLPNYIDRISDEMDTSDYQTVYAKNDGSIAAPTAGLHFTKELLDTISAKGIDIAYVTLHVGIGTFLPLSSLDLHEHKMHSENYLISSELLQKIALCKSRGGRIVAVGTTTVRALESFMLREQQIAGMYSTNLFITPGFKFKLVNALVTNFHLPNSTLVVMVSTILGKQKVLDCYKYALSQGYKFYSFGDAMFIEVKNEI